MSKRNCHRLKQRQQEREEVEAALAKFSRIGLIGKPEMVDGELHYWVGPEHIALMCKFLSHPEKWPDHWSDEQRAKAYAIRDEAIAKGMVQP